VTVKALNPLEPQYLIPRNPTKSDSENMETEKKLTCSSMGMGTY
jgi:hypothetical protein